MPIVPLYLITLLLILAAGIVVGRLVYEQPTFPLYNPNFTLGGLFNIDDGHHTGIDQSLAMMCTLKVFNDKAGPFPLDGTFNGIIYDSGKTLDRAEYATMQLLQYNLVNNAETTDLRPKIGAIVVDVNTDVFFATQPIFSGFPFTYLGVQFLSDSIGFNTSSIPNPRFKARIVPQSYVISASTTSSMAGAITKMLIYFSWSLVTVIYSRDTFGMEGQAFLQPLLQHNSILTICSTITDDSEDRSQKIKSLTNCINSNESRVVIVWSGANSRAIAKLCSQIQSQCTSKLTFISPGSEADSSVDTSVLKQISTSFLFKNSNLVPYSDAFKDCLASIKPGRQSFYQSDFFEKYWLEKFNCSSGENQCIRESVIETTIEINQVSDTVMVVLKAISLMQNNCSFLTNLLDSHNLNVRNQNFCTKSQFTAADIYDIVNMVLYVGLPEYLILGSLDPPSAWKSLQIIQINQTGQLVPVGEFTSHADLIINNQSLYWPDGKSTQSEVTIDNPSFDDAIVIVFFSFTCVGIIYALGIIGLFTYYRKERSVRKSSVRFNFLILFGIILILTGFIFDGLEYTVATCFLFTWLVVLGSGLSASCILAKSYRIYKIFKNPAAKAIHIPDSRLYIIVGSIMLIEIGLLSVYSFCSGLLGPAVFQSASDIYYKYRICTVPSQGVQIAFTIILYAFNLMILFIAAGFAFIMRKVDNGYSEAKGIAYTVYSTLLFQIIFLPLLYTTGDSTDSATTRYAITGIIICCTANFSITFLFFGKIAAIFKIKRS